MLAMSQLGHYVNRRQAVIGTVSKGGHTSQIPVASGVVADQVPKSQLAMSRYFDTDSWLFHIASSVGYYPYPYYPYRYSYYVPAGNLMGYGVIMCDARRLFGK